MIHSIACKPILEEINSVYKQGCVIIEVETENIAVPVKIYVGSDMKFLATVYGIAKATAKYACIWCKVKQDDRHNVSKSLDYWNSTIARTLEEHISIAKQGKTDFGVKNMPLLSIDFNSIIPCEMHMMIRIGDVLLRNIMDDAADRDAECKVLGEQSVFVKNIVKAIQQECCIPSVETWYICDPITNHPTDKLTWTQLTGTEYKKFFEKFPDSPTAQTTLHQETVNVVLELVSEFWKAYQMANTPPVVDSEEARSALCDEMFQQTKAWINKFTSLGSKRKGYRDPNRGGKSPAVTCSHLWSWSEWCLLR